MGQYEIPQSTVQLQPLNRASHDPIRTSLSDVCRRKSPAAAMGARTDRGPQGRTHRRGSGRQVARRRGAVGYPNAGAGRCRLHLRRGVAARELRQGLHRGCSRLHERPRYNVGHDVFHVPALSRCDLPDIVPPSNRGGRGRVPAEPHEFEDHRCRPFAIHGGKAHVERRPLRPRRTPHGRSSWRRASRSFTKRCIASPLLE